jgi:hypothetical protein
MTEEQTKKLLTRFPILYQEYYHPMQETCMCWGFSCGSGWYKLLYQLSLAIEEELGYSWTQKKMFLVKHRLSRKWNSFIYWLSPVGKEVYDPLARFFNWIEPRETSCRKYPEKPSRLYWWANLGFKRFAWFPYTGFAVSQVKEKLGTLRYYCPSTDAIEDYIALAERLSAITCENCGKFGKLYYGSYIRCLCPNCALAEGRSTLKGDDDEGDEDE